jgi:hypothetical protein
VRLTRDLRRRQLAWRYAAAAVLFAALAFTVGGIGLWLFWPAVSLLLVALNYAVFGAAGFQKQQDGRLSMAATWLLAPYIGAAWINSRLWTRKHPQPDQVVDNVWLGRIPSFVFSTDELQSSPFAAVVDLCAELPLDARAVAYRSLPVLDLTPPDVEQCREAARAIEQLRQHGPLLVCCALGYSRSATAVAAWLLHTGRARDVDAAIEHIQEARPHIILHAEHRLLLASFMNRAENVDDH